MKKRDRGVEKEKNKFSKDLIKSLGEAHDHAEGRAGSARVHLAEVPDATYGPSGYQEGCIAPAIPAAGQCS